MVMKKSDIDCFNPAADLSIVNRSLPHWIQAGCLCFVTWRLNDSLPMTVLSALDSEIAGLLRDHELDPAVDWKAELNRRDSVARGKVHWKLFCTRDRFLDQGLGECHFKHFEIAQIVMESLLHFDEQRYYLSDAIVMPNHVHFIAAFPDEEKFLSQCTQWKRFTARAIHQRLNRTGEFWQVDQFDHLIRGPE